MADHSGFRTHIGVCGIGHQRSVSILGTILTIAGFVGWFHDVLPHEKHESVPVEEKCQLQLPAARLSLGRMDDAGTGRARLPLEIYRFRGVKAVWQGV